MSLHSEIIKILLNTPTSLSDLQLATQVSLPTLRRAVQELSEAQWIRIVGQAEANGGRPAMLFGMDDHLYIVVGLHLQLPGMRMIVSDLTGRVLNETSIFNGVIPTPSEAVSAAADYVSRVRKEFSSQKILGIGIAAPGFIDPSSGDIITIGRVPGWGNFPFCRHLNAVVNLPVHISNDVDCMAFAEFEHTQIPQDKSLAFIGFDEGVKASLFLNGKIYKGSIGNTGLIASQLLAVNHHPDPEEVRSLLTINGVNRAFERRVSSLDHASQAIYASILGTTNPRDRFQLVISQANDNFPICQSILNDLMSFLSVAVANLIFVFQPNTVVIGGLLSLISSHSFSHLESTIRGYLPALISNNSIIQQGKLTSLNTAAIGSIHHFMQNYLTDTFFDLA